MSDSHSHRTDPTQSSGLKNRSFWRKMFQLKNALLTPVALFFIFGLLSTNAQVAHHIAAANIMVVQNDTSNNTTSVTVSTGTSINDFRIRPGSNRADYNVQIGNLSTDDVS